MSTLLIKHAELFNPGVKGSQKTDILVENGRFAKIEPDIAPVPDAQILDATGKSIYPGMVDAHCHTGLSDFGNPDSDYNERNDPVTPHLRAIDAFNPLDKAISAAGFGGVTTFATGPGSANVIGGLFMAVKPVPGAVCVDDMVINPAIAMKAAFGENPKRLYYGSKISSKMTTAALLREMLFKAREYANKIEKAEREEKDAPSFDFKLSALVPVITGKIPLKVHAHKANDIFTAIRIAKEFGIRITLDHCTEGHLIADKLAEFDYPVAIGPTMGFPKKQETREKGFKTPGILAKAGCLVSIITDAEVMEQNYLPLMAAQAINAGMDPDEAFKAITINPAKMLGLEDRIGSIEVGKDADFLITSGDPIRDFSRDVIENVYVNGVEYTGMPTASTVD